MAGRWVRLAIRAHLTGALDYSEAGACPNWGLKEELVLQGLEDDLFVRVNELSYNWHCAAAGSGAWDEDGEAFEFHRKEADKTFQTMGRLLLPWYKDWKETEKSLAQLWKEFKEEEKNPKFKAWRTNLKQEMLAKEQTAIKQEERLALSHKRKLQLEEERKRRRRPRGRR